HQAAQNRAAGQPAYEPVGRADKKADESGHQWEQQHSCSSTAAMQTSQGHFCAARRLRLRREINEITDGDFFDFAVLKVFGVNTHNLAFLQRAQIQAMLGAVSANLTGAMEQINFFAIDRERPGDWMLNLASAVAAGDFERRPFLGLELCDRTLNIRHVVEE